MGLGQQKTYLRFKVTERGRIRKCETPGYSLRNDTVADVMVRFISDRIKIQVLSLRTFQVTWSSSKKVTKLAPKYVEKETINDPTEEQVGENLLFEIRRAVTSLVVIDIQ